MQGSFGDATERFRGGKKKDNEKSKHNRQDQAFRNKRRKRHASLED